MKPSPALELLAQLSPRPKPVGDVLADLRINVIELRALCDDLRLMKVSTRLFRAAHDTNRITHVSISGKSWGRAQELADDYLRTRELVGAA